MCSRFEIDGPKENIANYFDLGELPIDFNLGEVRPTNNALIIEPGNKARMAKWGIPAPWDGKPLINARSETLDQKQSFRPLLESRCIVPASAYFEWRKIGKQRLKNRISLKDENLMGFAGLISGDHFTIITCEPVESIAYIHNRMPVILPSSARIDWCDNTKPFSNVSHYLKRHDTASLTAIEEKPPQTDLFS